MKLAELLLPEFDRETAVTRLLVERAPEPRLEWRPHPKSWTLGDLCVHIAQLPLWAALVMEQASFDPNPVDGTAPPRPRFESKAVTLRTFDEHVTRARGVLASASDPELLAPWTLRDAGRPLFTMPKVAVLRSFVFNHLVHHRGQLTVYLRLCDVALPPVYGPTADTVAAPASEPDAGASPNQGGFEGNPDLT